MVRGLRSTPTNVLPLGKLGKPSQSNTEIRPGTELLIAAELSARVHIPAGTVALVGEEARLGEVRQGGAADPIGSGAPGCDDPIMAPSLLA
jgi:hypothetical protein